MVVLSAPVSGTDLVLRSTLKDRLARSIEEAPLERQQYFERHMTELPGEGRCEWCHSRGERLWKVWPRNTFYPPKKHDGTLSPMAMCYRCCELELSTPRMRRYPEVPLGEVEPTDNPIEYRYRGDCMTMRRDRSKDLESDGKPPSPLWYQLFIESNEELGKYDKSSKWQSFEAKPIEAKTTSD